MNKTKLIVSSVAILVLLGALAYYYSRSEPKSVYTPPSYIIQDKELPDDTPLKAFPAEVGKDKG